MAALAAGWLTIAWVIQDVTDHYFEGHWFGLPVIIAAASGLLLSLRSDRRGAWLILLAAAGAGIVEHLWRPAVSQSNVLAEIAQASDLLRGGHDPYRALGSQMVDGVYLYPPGPLVLYGSLASIGVAPITVERATSILTVVLLAATARWIGPGRAALVTAMYGTYLFGTFRALDGDNNSTLALLFLGASLLLMRAETPDRAGRIAFWASVPVLALGILMKQLAWPVYAFIALYLAGTRRGRWHVAATLAVVGLAILPFAIDDPGMLPRMLAVVGNKPTVYGLNLLGILQMFDPALAARLIPATLVVQVGVAALAAVALTRTGSRDIPDALTRSLGVMLALMLLSSWTSPAYYMFMGSILLLVVAVAGVRSPRPSRGLGWSDLRRGGATAAVP
ncbi:MAG TPA: hypothetical protein VGT60_12005 [Candidatus Limnocylindria bacterium]|nr:hypothetical protein [Candidatus Limnocylindria bacterium]